MLPRPFHLLSEALGTRTNLNRTNLAKGMEDEGHTMVCLCVIKCYLSMIYKLYSLTFLSDYNLRIIVLFKEFTAESKK